jgi:hypothetical protein
LFWRRYVGKPVFAKEITIQQNQEKEKHMKITLSKQQWELIGRKTGWIKKAQESVDSKQEASLKEKMSEATHLALQIVYATTAPDGTYLETKEVNLPDEVWAWADGLTHKYYEKQMNGETSLQNLIDFDVGKFEEEVDKDIEKFKQLLKKVGPPKRLTKEEMIAKGYRWE